MQLAAGNDVGGGLVRVLVDAPIYVQPDSNREPLRIAKEGSVLRMIRVEGAFAYVEFADPDYPRRYGYIRSQAVEPLAPPRQEPLDLTVPEARQGVPAPLARPAPTPTTTQAVRDPSLVQQPPPVPVVRPSPPDTPARTSGGGFLKSSGSRFFVGVGLEGNGVVTNARTNDTEAGTGVGLVLGYGFNHIWSLYGEISAADIKTSGGGSYALAHVDIGTRIHFLAGPHRAVPFVQVGVSGRGESESVAGTTLDASGTGVAFGGGVNIHFSPKVAFSPAVVWSVGDFNKYRVNGRDVSGNNVSVVSARVHIGIVVFPWAHSS